VLSTEHYFKNGILFTYMCIKDNQIVHFYEILTC